jgi:TctA family transporter
MYIGYELVNEKRFTHKTKRELTYFVVGYFILSLAMSVPFFGWFVKLLAGIWGMGGLIELLKRKNA